MNLPDDYLTALGRVVAGCAQLEGQLASLVLILTGGEAGQGDWLKVIDDKPLSRLRRLTPNAPAEFRPWLTEIARDAGARFDARDRLVHSLAVMNPGDDSVPWLSVHPRSGSIDQLDTAEKVDELARRIEALGARTITKMSALADSLRTGEGT